MSGFDRILERVPLSTLRWLFWLVLITSLIQFGIIGYVIWSNL